jgi:hypothetical protein
LLYTSFFVILVIIKLPSYPGHCLFCIPYKIKGPAEWFKELKHLPNK